MLGIAESGISTKLKERLKLFLEISSGRLLNYYGRIIQNELGITNHSIFLPDSEVSLIRKKIPYIIEGEATQDQIKGYLNEIKERKKEHRDFYRIQQAVIRNKKREMKKFNFSFDEFKDKLAEKHLIGLIKSILTKSDIINIESKAENIADNIIRYQYFNNFWNIIAALHYRYFACDYKVNDSDYYDALHLVYLTGLDAIFTNDKRLGEICKLIFHKSKKVIPFKEINKYL